MTLRSLSGVLSGQSLVAGRISNALTGRAPARVTSVSLMFRRAGTSGFLPFPVPPRLRDGGYYVFGGAPERALPALAPADSLELRLRVEAPGYDTAELDFTLSSAALTPVEESATVGGLDVTLPAFPVLPDIRDVALEPHPVALEGLVIDDDDPDAPVEGATARVTAPDARGPVTTDARGYFRIDAMPVALAVTVEITLGSRSLVREVELRTTEPVNQQTFSLPA